MTGYNVDVIQQTACLVANLIKAYNFAALFCCVMIGPAADSINAQF